jgi:hypothetical protein
VTSSRTQQPELALDPAGINRVLQETIADRAFVELVQEANISLVAALRRGPSPVSAPSTAR